MGHPTARAQSSPSAGFQEQKDGPIAGAKFQEATDLVGNVRKGDESRSASRNGSG